ncbi:hypothetical protein [Flavobacterium foetidum]|uniref:hypothetical protein n=1 Tax=Flavobacterium foetidum TaxID=2026681 RepID=UPI001074B848|nr:hypothetical protein [Flavobacterium foetidum]KAF2515552.1 hypothetical protein E0W73_08130 [Flavobacterium foetidum]
MKNNTIKKSNMKTIKKGIFALMAVLGIGLSAQAQEVTNNVTKQGAVGAPGADPLLGGSVRVIDNKGTIKYLQVQNGITQITNSNAGGNIVTTWQLGGTLTNETYIDVAGKAFALDGLKLATNQTASTDAKDLSTHTTSDRGTGLTLLVRDEATGETMKMKFEDLVNGGQSLQTATAGSDIVFSDPTLPTTVEKVWVYRNGAKLVAGQDYTWAAATGVTVKNVGGGTDPDDYAFMTGDKIEIHWIK